MNEELLKGILEALEGINTAIRYQNEQLEKLNDTIESITVMSPHGITLLNVAASVFEN